MAAMIRIKSKRHLFYRGGIPHSSTWTEYPVSVFSDRQLDLIRNEPMLDVEEWEDETPTPTVSDDAPTPDPDAELIAAAKMCVDAGHTIASGRPDITAMAELLGRNITAADRDRAYAKMQAMTSKGTD